MRELTHPSLTVLTKFIFRSLPPISHLAVLHLLPQLLPLQLLATKQHLYVAKRYPLTRVAFS